MFSDTQYLYNLGFFPAVFVSSLFFCWVVLFSPFWFSIFTKLVESKSINFLCSPFSFFSTSFFFLEQERKSEGSITLLYRRYHCVIHPKLEKKLLQICVIHPFLTYKSNHLKLIFQANNTSFNQGPLYYSQNLIVK